MSSELFFDHCLLKTDRVTSEDRGASEHDTGLVHLNETVAGCCYTQRYSYSGENDVCL